MFEIISHGGGAFIHAVLNGVAMFFGSNDYLFALKMCATLSALGILVSSAFQGRIPDMKWIIIMVSIYMFAFVPKVDVTVTDTVERSPGMFGSASLPTVRVAGNVPMGLAFVASFTSHMSDYITRGFETVFSFPETSLNFRNNGPMFAEAISEKVVNAKPRDPNLAMSLSNFWRDCVFYDLALGFYSMSTLAQANDIKGFLSNNTAVGRAYEHYHADGTKTFEMCRDSISAGALSNDLLNNEPQASNNWIAKHLDWATPKSNMQSVLTSQAAAMPVAFQYLVGVSMSQSQLLAQTTLANSFGDGLVAFGNAAEAQTVVQGYVAAKAEAERHTTFTVLTKLSAKMLPILKNIFEGFLYAVAPIIGLMMMFPAAGKVAMGYLTALLWIALWSPLFAIFHWGGMFYTKLAAEKAVTDCVAGSCSTNFNMYNMQGLSEVFAHTSTIMGFVGVSIPMIAYMLVSRSGAMMSGLSGRVMDGYQQTVSSASGEAAAGNISMGQMNYQNVSAFQQNTAPKQTSGFSEKNTGDMQSTQTASGNIYNAAVSSIGTNVNFSEQLGNRASSELAEAHKRTEQTDAAFTQSSAAVLTQMKSHMEGASQGRNYNANSGLTIGTSTQKAYDEVKQTGEQLAKSLGLSSEQFSQTIANFQGGLSGSIGPVKLGADGSYSVGGRKIDKEGVDQINSYVQTSAIKLQNAVKEDNTTTVGQGFTFKSEDGNQNSLGAALSKNEQAATTHTQAVGHETQMRESVQSYRDSGAGINRNLNQELVRELEDKYGQDEAVRLMKGNIHRGLNGEDSQKFDAAVQTVLDRHAPKAAFDSEAEKERISEGGGSAVAAHYNASSGEVRDQHRENRGKVPVSVTAGEVDTKADAVVTMSSARAEAQREELKEKERAAVQSQLGVTQEQTDFLNKNR